jgi:hypothetical protein
MHPGDAQLRSKVHPGIPGAWRSGPFLRRQVTVLTNTSIASRTPVYFGACPSRLRLQTSATSKADQVVRAVRKPLMPKRVCLGADVG